MRSSLIMPADARRHAFRGVVLATVFVAASAIGVSAQTPSETPQQPADQAQQPADQTAQPAQEQPAQQPAAPGRSFSSDAGMIFNIIKPDQTAAFEEVMNRTREALNQSQEPSHKQMAQSWKVFKSVEPGPNGNVLYIWFVDPAVPNADYTVSKILASVFPTEAQALYEKYSGAYAAGQNLVNLQLITDMSKP